MGKDTAPMMMCAIALMFLAALLSGCEDQPPCIETAKRTVITYPNLSLQSLGPQYTAIALIPVFSEQEFCLKRATNQRE